jgi:putative acetyltransferase
MPAPDEILLREAIDTDGPALARLIEGVFSEYDGVVFVAAEFPELSAIATHVRRHGGHLWVAVANGAIVGSLGELPTHVSGVAEFIKVYVARAHRGRCIAARLFLLAMDHLRRRGTTAISLWSDTKFLEGHRFYQRLGFVRAPGVRALHDASETLEFNFRLGPGASWNAA